MTGLVEDAGKVIDLAIKLAKFVAKPATVAYKDIVPKLRLGLSKYTKASEVRFGKTKTLLYRDSPQPIENFYVRTRLKCGQHDYDDKSFSDAWTSNTFAAITGIGGSGKSIFLRKFFLDQLRSGLTVPIFFELRNFNQAATRSLRDFLYDAISSYLIEFTFENFVDSMRAGVFSVLLDGFDEVDHDKRDYARAEILNLRAAFPKVKIVISSRPNREFEKWAELSVYCVSRLEKQDVLTLISKIEYDENVKKRFKEAIDSELWDAHQSFLSNPLLASIMLLTFEEYASIPHKKHLFYNQAFETLYIKHDAFKQMYKRKTYARLAIDEFRRIFSAFCMFSYIDGAIEFTEARLKRFVERSINYCGVECQSDDLISDLTESVCLLIADGSDYRFVHRSFQEYFTAVFLSTCDVGTLRTILVKIAHNFEFDDVIPMLYSMDRDRLDSDWVLPELERLIKRFEYASSGKIYEYVKYNSITLQTYLSYRRFNSQKNKRGFKRCFIAVSYGEKENEWVASLTVLDVIFGGLENMHVVAEDQFCKEALRREILVGAALYSAIVEVFDIQQASSEGGNNLQSTIGVVRRKIGITKRDCDWLRRTSWFKTEAHRYERLVFLKNEVSQRVKDRQQSLSETIFA